jgi:hypothetical protein
MEHNQSNIYGHWQGEGAVSVAGYNALNEGRRPQGLWHQAAERSSTDAPRVGDGDSNGQRLATIGWDSQCFTALLQHRRSTGCTREVKRCCWTTAGVRTPKRCVTSCWRCEIEKKSAQDLEEEDSSWFLLQWRSQQRSHLRLLTCQEA